MLVLGTRQAPERCGPVGQSMTGYLQVQSNTRPNFKGAVIMIIAYFSIYMSWRLGVDHGRRTRRKEYYG